MPPPTVLEFARLIVRQAVAGDCLVLDATVGNGYDTEFLARTVGASGIVVGLDIQKSAITNTDGRLRRTGLRPRVRLFQQGHEDVREVLAPLLGRPLRAAMYNLGYLPGSEKRVTTRPETTVKSLQDVAVMLATGGVVTVVAYRGHTGGEEEACAVHKWCRELPRDRFVVSSYAALNQGEQVPQLFAVSKTISSGR